MKKIVVIDGNDRDVEKITAAAGEGYDVSARSSYEMMRMTLSPLITIVNTLDSSDEYNGGHSLRVAVVARDIAKNLGWDRQACDDLYFICLLHDIGMITVPDIVRNKPGRLTDSEYDIIKTHCATGAKMLRDMVIPAGLKDGVLSHHERWDGRGYPEGLAGEGIPAVARILSIADAYDAMSCDRVYRKRLSGEKIISEFLRCRGTQFDPEITDVFVFMLKEGYCVEPGIEQSKQSSERAVRDGGYSALFSVYPNSGNERNDEYDEITGLFTRAYLNTRIGKKISEERTGALMLIDLRGFSDLCKNRADSSDTVLRMFSDRLRSYFREADVVCHLSQGSFAVYVSGESGKNVIEKKAEMITKITDDHTEFAKYPDITGVSVGIAMCQEDGVTFEELFGVASEALREVETSDESAYKFVK